MKEMKNNAAPAAVAVPDEREAFEQWLGIKPCGAAHDFGWAAWQARAALAATPAAEPFGYFKAEPFGWTDCGPDDEGAVALYEKPQALLATGGQAQADCERCKGSGEDPEGYYDQSRGPDGDTHEGPCRTCNGTGAAPQQADSRDAVTFEQRMSDWQHGDALDAERYRWLRSRDLETISQGGVFAGMTPQNDILNEEDLDQAVDAAIAAAKGEQK